MIEVCGLTKQYGSLLAVSDLNFKVMKGSVSGIVGANGAGKSTTLRMLAGVLGATCGTVRICGHDIVTAPLQARQCLGYVAEGAPLYADMSVRRYLRYRAALKGVMRSKREQNVFAAAKDTGCLDYLDTTMTALSRGHRQRVALADALVASPPVVLLDEPAAGLDSNQVRDLQLLIGRLREHHAIVIASHALADAQTFCTSLLVLHNGRLIADDTVEALRSKCPEAEITLSLRDPEHRAEAIILDSGWQLCSTRVQGAELTTEFSIKAPLAHVQADEAVEALVAALAASGIGIRAVERSAATLEAAISFLVQLDQKPSP